MPERKYLREDETLNTLLDLDGEIFLMEDDYWTKFEATRVKPTRHKPHGVRYSLTLHDKNNPRILGFDNAHAVKPKKKKYQAREITWDHKHKKEKFFPYEYEPTSQLLEDFWVEVEQIIK